MAASWWPGACSITFTHAEKPIVLPYKDGEKEDLLRICKNATPPCNLNPMLFNGHLQTIWTARAYDGPPIHYKRRVWKANTPKIDGHFAVDYVVPPPGLVDKKRDEENNPKDDRGLTEDPTGIGHTELPPRTTYFTNEEFEALPSDDTKPLLIMLHGLSGGSYETYLRHVVQPLVRGTKQGKVAGISGGDWEVLVINSRGCAGSRLTNSLLYNARSTWDMRQVVNTCRKMWPNRPLFGCGFSLGANMLTIYLGEEGEHCPLKAACVVSNPWALDITHVKLQSSLLGRQVYSRAMGSSMKALVKRHQKQVSENPGINFKKVDKIRYLWEFDREVQCPSWNFPSFSVYHRDASSTDAVLSVRVPTMALHAEDDPVVNDHAVPYEDIRATPYVVMVSTSGGGHLSWFELNGGRWYVKPVVNFLNHMAEIDYDNMKRPDMPKRTVSDGPQPFEYQPMRRKVQVREFSSRLLRKFSGNEKPGPPS